MFITYNGITLAIARTHNCSMEAVYDDSTQGYLYTRLSYDVEAQVNPARTAYALDGTTGLLVHSEGASPDDRTRAR